MMFKANTSGRIIRADLLLLISAFFWGFAFVAQRAGSQFLSPFLFNGFRFLLGGVLLIPVLRAGSIYRQQKYGSNYSELMRGSFLAGIALFCAATLQQYGITETSAGNAGFITGLYVIIVPVLGLFFKHRTSDLTWAAALLAVLGLYLLSYEPGSGIRRGDALVLASAFFWALHVLIIANLVQKNHPVSLACLQFLICGLLSLGFGAVFESCSLPAVRSALIPLLYAGIFSIAISFTLQMIAQRTAPPSHAAVLLSMEAVFAVVGGFIILQERFALRAYLGCGLMFLAMIISQSAYLKPLSFLRKPASY